MPLSFEKHCSYVTELVARADQSLRRVSPEAPVPGCPDWDAAELRDHCAGVLAFWIEQLRVADPAAGRQFGPEVRERHLLPLHELSAEVVTALTAAGPDRPCWNWSGADQTSAWVARRMANEFAIHSADAAATAGLAVRIPTDLAVDGIDELLDVFLGHDPEVDFEGHGTVLWDAASEGLWTVEVGEAGVRRARRQPTAWVRGSVDQLLLHLWGRPSEVNQHGDRAPMNQFRQLATFD